MALGNMSPVYLTTTASGQPLPIYCQPPNAVTLAVIQLPEPQILHLVALLFDILAQSNATPTSNVEEYKAFTNAEIRNSFT